jgi:hypothetical protein
MDMYFMTGTNCIILSRLPIKEHKLYLLDEVYNNYILRISIHINDRLIHIYNVNIRPSVFECLNCTNTFVSNIIEDNYNTVPCIITGIIHNTLYNRIIASIGNNTAHPLKQLNRLLPLESEHQFRYNYNTTQFAFVNSMWCNQSIYIMNKTNIGTNGIEMNLKVE